MPRDFALRFTDAKGGVKIVAWTSPPAGETADKVVEHEVGIAVGKSGAIETLSLYGDKSTLFVANNTLTVKLTDAPQYFTRRAATN
jgi:hypothetical protein